jgi:D-3-phosphoglycerate dehydrogenase
LNNIYITTTTFGTFSSRPFELLEENQIIFSLNDRGRKLEEKEIINLLKSYEGLIAGTEVYSMEVLCKLPNLKVISRLGVGMDNIDLEYAKTKGIKVFKTETSPGIAVAELTLALILDLLRRVSLQNNRLKSSNWGKQMGELLTGKTIGIVGLGNIGKQLVKILNGFKVKVLAHDIVEDFSFAKKNNVDYVDLEKLLKKSDIVSIHSNLSSKTKKLIDYEKLKIMKKNALLINASRGELIDESSLLKALDEKLIQGAGLDVFENEPYSGPLINYDNVVLTPHVGAYAKEIRTKMELEATNNLINGLKNG